MTNLFKDFHKLCDSESQPQAQDFVLSFENAALKEQVAQLKSSVQHEADCVDSAAAEINRQAAENNKLKETIAQLAEAIRLKDEALLNLLSVIDSEAYPTIQNNGYDTVAIQPSPEILQARDKRVAEACAKVCIEQSEGIARSTPVSRDRVHTLVESTMFKGIARAAPVRDCSESSVRESAFRIRNGAWERHF